MRSPSIIPPDVLRVQGEVSDPGVSAWVAANAGSGKTHVLAPVSYTHLTLPTILRV